ncbi:MAG: ABC transporter permease [Rhodospirillaceae bacterium]|nr:ABC transporter permease [Rhodospirillaceae bacterium]
MAAETGTSSAPRGRGESVTRRMFRLAWEMTSFKIGLGVFTLLVGAAIIWPELSPYDPMKISVRERFLPPIFLEGGTWAHIAGTDQLGRDLFVRSLVGLRNGLGIAAAAVAIMFVVGCALGVISGYWGRWVDIIIMRITDAQLSIPVIVLAITILSVSRPNPFTVTAVLVLAGWPIYARVVRSIALAEREREYVRGAKILGASDLRIATLMISPNILPPIAFVAVLDIARMMIFEALFGFLGIGIQPPTPTFGNIIADGYKYLVNSWWIPTMPGVFLILTLISINLMGASLERARNKLFKGIV